MAIESTQPRLLAWEGCLNARDLGGYPTKDGRETSWGAVVRSDNLTPLTEEGRAALIAYGVRMIVDLRRPSEVAQLPNPFAEPGPHGIAYANVPFEVPETDPPGEPESLAAQYRWMLGAYRPGVAAIVTAIARAPEGGVLIHCMGGQDRTGLIAALLLGLAGVERELIGADYALTAECLRPRTQDWLENGPGERAERERMLARYTPRAEVMLEVLDYVDERHGGVEPYLRSADVTTDDIARIRARLLLPPGSG